MLRYALLRLVSVERNTDEDQTQLALFNPPKVCSPLFNCGISFVVRLDSVSRPELIGRGVFTSVVLSIPSFSLLAKSWHWGDPFVKDDVSCLAMPAGHA